MIEITSDEARLLAQALTIKATDIRSIGASYPLRSQDSETRRYELMDEAHALYERARELRSLSVQEPEMKGTA